MADAPSLNATFFAFRKRAQGGVLLRASIAFFLIIIVMSVVFYLVLGLATGLGYAELATVGPTAGGPISPGAWAGMGLGYLVYMFGVFLLFAAYEAACLRWMIRGETRGFMGLSLDSDTWRVYATYWMWFIVVVVGWVLLTIVLVASIGAAAGAAAVANQGSGGGGMWVVIVPLVVFLVMLVPIYFCVRFAPAAAISVGLGRFAFFTAWAVSRKRFWALFGSFFLLWLLYLIFYGLVLGAWFMTAIGPAAADIFSGGDPTTVSLAINEAMMAAVSTPLGLTLYIGMQVIGMVIGLVFYVLIFGVNARAVVAAGEEGKVPGLTGPGTAETFS